jgi:hypothetical protein
MSRLIISALSLTLLLICVHEAAAAQRGLLLLDNFQQKVDLSYQFDTDQNKSKSTERHYLNESYTFDINYGIFDQRILNGHLSASMQFLQQNSSGSNELNSSTSAKQFQYNFSGKLYESSPASVGFHSSSTINAISRDFSPDYQVETDNLGVMAHIKNKLLPLEVSYERTLNHTSGLNQNYSITNNTFGFLASNDYKNTGRTDLRLSANKDVTDVGNVTSENQQFNVGLTNANTFFTQSKPLNMINAFSFSEQNSSVYSKALGLSHSLSWIPGRALTLGFNYSFSNHARDNQKDELQRVQITLTHRLFQSLETSMDITAKRNNLSIGPEDETTGTINLRYNKLLPLDSRLKVDLRQQYGVTTRAFVTGQVTAIDEAHTIDASKVFTLQHPNANVGSIVILNSNPLTHPLPYVLDIDYRIIVIGAQTQISTDIPGSQITVGDKLNISYNYQVDPRVSYATNSRGVSSTLSLFSNKYSVFAMWQESYQTMLSGHSTTVNFTEQSSYQIGFSSQFDKGEFTSDYSSTTSTGDQQQSLYGSIRYGGGTGRGASYMLSATNRYSLITSSDITGHNTREQRTNRTSVSATYNTTLLNTIICMLTTQYAMERISLSRDDVSLSMRLQWRAGKLSLSLLSQLFYRKNVSDWALDEHVRFDLTRYF